MSSVTVAGTVPWRDPLDAPPDRTVPALRERHGVEIFVQLEAGRLFRPGPESTPLRLGSIGPASHGSGPLIPGLSIQSGAFVVAHQYDVSVDVIYGRRHPSPEQLTEARAELARLVLPRWPHWWRG